jgi:hypothetical protein
MKTNITLFRGNVAAPALEVSGANDVTQIHRLERYRRMREEMHAGGVVLLMPIHALIIGIREAREVARMTTTQKIPPGTEGHSVLYQIGDVLRELWHLTSP